MRQDAEPAHLRWLIDAGAWRPKDSHAANMQRLADARVRWSRMDAEPGKDWARRIVADYRAGVALHPYAIKLAMQALGMPEETILRTPSRPVPRPDRMETAAGDVEVQW